MKLRLFILWLVALFVLVWTNGVILQKEILLSESQSIFLELAPRDPRSLIQGDYMVLRYALTRDANLQSLPTDGLFVLKIDEKQVAHFARLHTPGVPLTANEVLLRYRKRGGDIWLGAESFFFQEGHADYYSAARYAELKVGESGESVLIGLRGPNLELLSPPDNVDP
jgi:uncharacterized membrane-anchored protein